MSIRSALVSKLRIVLAENGRRTKVNISTTAFLHRDRKYTRCECAKQVQLKGSVLQDKVEKERSMHRDKHTRTVNANARVRGRPR